MQNINQEQVAALLDRNDYRVVVNTTDGGCFTQFPSRIELPLMAFACLYQEYTPTGLLIGEHDENGTELKTQELSCPSYAQRLFTVYHIIYHCVGIGYDINLVKFVVDKEEVPEGVFLEHHVSPFMEEGDVQLETVLKNIVAQCFRQGFLPMYEKAAKQEKVLEGFTPIRRLFVPDDMMKQLTQMIGEQHE